MKKRELSIVTVSRKGEASITSGNPWVYDSEVFDDDLSAPDGAAVDIVNQHQYKADNTCDIHSAASFFRNKIRITLPAPTDSP